MAAARRGRPARAAPERCWKCVRESSECSAWPISCHSVSACSRLSRPAGRSATSATAGRCQRPPGSARPQRSVKCAACANLPGLRAARTGHRARGELAVLLAPVAEPGALPLGACGRVGRPAAAAAGGPADSWPGRLTSGYHNEDVLKGFPPKESKVCLLAEQGKSKGWPAAAQAPAPVVEVKVDLAERALALPDQLHLAQARRPRLACAPEHSTGSRACRRPGAPHQCGGLHAPRRQKRMKTRLYQPRCSQHSTD